MTRQQAVVASLHCGFSQNIGKEAWRRRLAAHVAPHHCDLADAERERAVAARWLSQHVGRDAAQGVWSPSFGLPVRRRQEDDREAKSAPVDRHSFATETPLINKVNVVKFQ